MHGHVFETMGTMASMMFRGQPAGPIVLERVETDFSKWDARYSLYRADSELSRIAAGDLALTSASDHLRSTYAAATEWRAATGGAFTSHRPDGILDLSGIVKALAIASGGARLDEAGVHDWGINVGGDVLVASTEPAWNIGIVDPADRGEFLTSVALTGDRRACATSGNAERGDHIWASTGGVDFSQVTVLADDIVTADVLATAIVSGGTSMLDEACSRRTIDVITVDRAGGIRMTPGAVQAMHAASAGSRV